METCNHCSELLLDHLYGLLDADQTQRLRAHLAACPACQAELASAERQQQLLARAARVYDHVAPFVAPSGDTVTAGGSATDQVPVQPAPVAEPRPATLPLPAARPGRKRLWPWA